VRSFWLGALVIFVAGSATLATSQRVLAIETAPAPPAPAASQPPGKSPEESRREQTIGFLPQAEQDRVIDAYNKAVAADPELKSQRAKLRKERLNLDKSDAPGWRSYRERVRMYQQKLRAAMLKVDGSLGPVLDKIDKHRSEMRAKHPDQW